MKLLLTITAIIEFGTGVALLIAPALVAEILLSTSLSDPAFMIICRLLGTALFTLAMACWFFKSGSASSLMIKVMLSYNFLSMSLLLYAVLVEGISGPGLWPAVLLHIALLIWCISSLLKERRTSDKPGNFLYETK